MVAALKAWCRLAKSTRVLSLSNFADALLERKVGICNYGKYKLTNARVEAGNVSIGLLRRRARGVKDIDYFKLKDQTNISSRYSLDFLPKYQAHLSGEEPKMALN